MKSLIHTVHLLLLTSLAGLSYPQVSQIERDALIALYNATDGANWRDSTNWLGEPGTECTWKGVQCDKDDSIISLRLMLNYLTGSIPKELGNLRDLTHLDLQRNSLSGSIPIELGNLKNLEFLWLQFNSLSGSIPSELSNLTALQGLYLYNNSLSGSIPS